MLFLGVGFLFFGRQKFFIFKGFLAALASGRSLEKCVKAGNFAARTIIQNVGCTFPDNCDYKEE